jgi:hypothetical protein
VLMQVVEITQKIKQVFSCNRSLVSDFESEYQHPRQAYLHCRHTGQRLTHNQKKPVERVVL